MPMQKTNPIRTIIPRQLLAIALLALAITAGFSVTAVESVEALGNNRTVTRSCGKNYIASGSNSTYSAWAVTQKTSGSCQGRLWAGLKGSSFEEIISGSTSYVEFNRVTATRAQTGIHKGCDSCSESYT